MTNLLTVITSRINKSLNTRQKNKAQNKYYTNMNYFTDLIEVQHKPLRTVYAILYNVKPVLFTGNHSHDKALKQLLKNHYFDYWKGQISAISNNFTFNGGGLIYWKEHPLISCNIIHKDDLDIIYFDDIQNVYRWLKDNSLDEKALDDLVMAQFGDDFDDGDGYAEWDAEKQKIEARYNRKG